MDSEKIVHDAAEKIRAIVSDAEEKAAQIVRDAEQEASRIRERADVEGRDRVAEVRQVLEELQDKLASGAAPSNGAKAEVNPGPVIVPEPQPPSPDPTPDPLPEPTPQPPSEPEPPLIPEPTPPPDEGTPPSISAGDNAAALEGGAKSDDAEGARLVAMNMALDGASREAIEAHLAENYRLESSGAIADDVLALVAN